MSRARLAVLGLAGSVIAGVAVAQQQAAPPQARAGSPTVLQVAGEQADTGVILMREIFTYEVAGRRDPFATLLESSELRPTLQELRLTGVLVHPTRPIAVMRDAGGTQYRVTTGMNVGRMRVIEIKPRTVVFAYSEYGYNRQDSLVLGDTAQVRPK